MKNTEILSFIKQDKLEKYIKFIIEKIKNDKEYSKLSKYLLDNCLKKILIYLIIVILENNNGNENDNKISENFFLNK